MSESKQLPISLALMPGETDDLWKTQIIECDPWGKFFLKVPFPCERRERESDKNKYSQIPRWPHFKVFIDWLEKCQEGLTCPKWTLWQSRKEGGSQSVTSICRNQRMDVRRLSGKNYQALLKKQSSLSKMQPSVHPSIHSYIHQVLRTYSTYNNTIQNCWESLFLFNHLTLLWIQGWEPKRWVKRKKNPSMLQNCLWSPWQRLLVFPKYQFSSFSSGPSLAEWLTRIKSTFLSRTLQKLCVCTWWLGYKGILEIVYNNSRNFL